MAWESIKLHSTSYMMMPDGMVGVVLGPVLWSVSHLTMNKKLWVLWGGIGSPKFVFKKLCKQVFYGQMGFYFLVLRGTIFVWSCIWRALPSDLTLFVINCCHPICSKVHCYIFFFLFSFFGWDLLLPQCLECWTSRLIAFTGSS